MHQRRLSQLVEEIKSRSSSKLYLCVCDFMMPSLARKVLICAAVDGLIVQPLTSKKDRSSPLFRIKYGDASVSAVSRELAPEAGRSFEAFGLVGSYCSASSHSKLTQQVLSLSSSTAISYP